jgi:hypothetical protein
METQNMFLPVDLSSCPTGVLPPLVQIGDEALYLIRGVVRTPGPADTEHNANVEFVVLEKDGHTTIIEADGHVSKPINACDILEMHPLAPENSQHYNKPPTLPARFREAFKSMASSPNNPYKLLEVCVRIVDPTMLLSTSGHMGERVIAVRLEDGTSVDALKTEVMVENNTKRVVSEEGLLVAAFPADRIVGVSVQDPKTSRHYQDFTP